MTDEQRGPSELSQSGLKDLLDEQSDLALAEVRRHAAQVRQEPDGLEVAALLLHDLPFLLAELESLRGRCEQDAATIRSQRDELRSLDLAVRTLQTLAEQQRSEIEALGARLEAALENRVQLAQALIAIIGATGGAALSETNREAYAAALEGIEDLLAEHTATTESGE